MQNPLLMANCKPFQSHMHVGLYISWRKKNIPITNNSFQVGLHELKDKVQVTLVREGIN